MLDFCPVERDINAYQKQIDEEEAYQEALSDQIAELYDTIMEDGSFFDARGREIIFQDIFNEMLLNNDGDLYDLMLQSIKYADHPFFDKIQELLLAPDGYLSSFADDHLQKRGEWDDEP